MAADDTPEVSGASAAFVAALAAVSAAPAARTPRIAPAEYAARRAALAKAIDADALFMAFSFEQCAEPATSTFRSVRKTTCST